MFTAVFLDNRHIYGTSMVIVIYTVRCGLNVYDLLFD